MKTDQLNQRLPGFFLHKYWVLIIAVVASLGAYAGMVGIHWRYGTLTHGQVPTTLIWYGAAFIAYLVALLWVERWKGLSLPVIFGGAILFRVLLLLTTPTLSTDVYRYLWDGYVATNEVSPYAYPIDSTALDFLDSPLRTLANHTWMASPYLPGAQYLFAGLAYFFPPLPITYQIVMLLIDLLNGVLLVNLLRIATLPGYRVLIYLWNPLVVVEVAHSAHVDAWMICLTLLTLWFTLRPNAPRSHHYLGPLVLALATLTKVLPVLLMPILFWRWRWWQLVLYFGISIGLLIPSGLAAGWGLTGPLDGTGLFGALRIYSEQWNFNSGLFHWLEVTLSDAGIGQATAWAKATMGGLMMLLMFGVWFKARQAQTLRTNLRLMAVPFMAYILLTTTVHPWYLMIVLAFLPFLPPGPTESSWRWLSIAPWLYLSAALALSYLTYRDPLDLREFEWARRVEWWPVWGLLLLLLIDTIWRESHKPRPRSAPRPVE